jgi:nitronate monooxygenase
VDLLGRLDLEHPVLQAGMAGGLSPPALVAAVLRAGALGTAGILPPERLRDELRHARDLAGGRAPAVNLLLPFTHRAHVDVCIAERARAVILFQGFDAAIVARLREHGIFVLHQVGTAAEGRRALADGADGLIAQGIEAGGHLLGVQPLAATLAAILEVADGKPVVAAGGIVSAADVAIALASGAAAVLCGTRFLLTDEAGAHPAYKRRILGAPRTIVTRLFGVGWHARHRVVPNLATERWCDEQGREPWIVAPVQRLAGMMARLSMPTELSNRAAERQRLSIPLYTPLSLQPGMAESLLEVTPLYAGEGVRAIHRVISAAQAVAELAGAARE